MARMRGPQAGTRLTFNDYSSFFHPTTIREDGRRTIDRGGHHAVVEMRSTTQGGGIEKAHVYADGFEPLQTLPPPGTPYLLPNNWYDQVQFTYVRWQTQRTGSSVGSSVPSGGNTPASTGLGGSGSRSRQSTPSSQQASSQWVPCGNGEERYYSASQGKYTNKYRRRNRRGGWDEFKR